MQIVFVFTTRPFTFPSDHFFQAFLNRFLCHFPLYFFLQHFPSIFYKSSSLRRSCKVSSLCSKGITREDGVFYVGLPFEFIVQKVGRLAGCFSVYAA